MGHFGAPWVNAESRGQGPSAFLHTTLTPKVLDDTLARYEFLRFESESPGREGNRHGCFRTAKSRARTLEFSGSQPSLG